MSKIDVFRAFLNKRLMDAAEEIFCEVEKTVTAYQVEISRSKEENTYLRRQLTELHRRAGYVHTHRLPSEVQEVSRCSFSPEIVQSSSSFKDSLQVTVAVEEAVIPKRTTLQEYPSPNYIKEEDAWTNFQEEQFHKLYPDSKDFTISSCLSHPDVESGDLTFQLRVMLHGNIQEMTLPCRPDTVDELIVMLKDALHLNFEFVLQYEDPDLDFEYVSLQTMEELPPGVIVKVVKTQGSDPKPWSNGTSHVLQLDVQPYVQQCRGEWPDMFAIPTFSYAVELTLEKGNSEFIMNGKSLTVNKEIKMDILNTMANKICMYNPYPNDMEISEAAEALVKRHPCLRDPGSEMGYQSWKQRLKFKMGNYRAKLRRDGVQEFTNGTSDPHPTEIHPPQRQNKWPDVFVSPVFSHAVELRLQRGNSEFMRNGKTLTLRREHKMNILTTMAHEIYKYKAYPNDKEISRAAEALVKKHPCLRDPGPKMSYQSWKHSLKFKMGNYRAKLRRVGLQEVNINGGKRSKQRPDSQAAHCNIKQARRGEVNFLPNLPPGEDADSLVDKRTVLIEEMRKDEINMALINHNMAKTFALRRQDIVTSSSQIDDFRKRWPALFLESQVHAEFHRLTNQSLSGSFYYGLDRCTPSILAVFKDRQAKSASSGEKFSRILEVYDAQGEQDVTVARSVVLAGLPLLLREEPTDVFRTCTVGEMNNPDTMTGDAAIVSCVEQVTECIPIGPHLLSIVLEDQEVISDLRSWPDAVLLLFGLLYILNVNYPKGMVSTFDFIQKVFFKLDEGQMAPKLLNLRNELYTKK